MKKLLATIPGLLGSDPGAILKYLEEIRKRGATGIRLFAESVWGNEDYLHQSCPYVFTGQWDINPEGYCYPLLKHEWNSEYFDLIEKICRQLKRLDMTLDLSLLDFCSWKGHSFDEYGRNKWWSPWYQFRGYYGGGYVTGEDLKPFHETWARKIISFVQNTGIHFDVEDINEFYVPEWMTPEEAIAWRKWWDEIIVSCGVPKEKIYMSADETPETIDVYKEMGKNVGYVCRHGISNIDRYQRMWHSPDCFPLTKRLLSNDGGSFNPGNDGPNGIWDAPKGRYRVETGVASAEWMADRIIENNMPGFEFLSHSVNWVGKDDGCGPYGYLEALAAMGRKFGTIPEKRIIQVCLAPPIAKIPNDYCSYETLQNRQYFSWEIPTEVCDIHKKPPEPPPPPPKKSWWEKLCRWLFGPNSLWRKIFG